VTRPDVLVVGAGVTGLALAWTLQQRGASVTVLERSGVGSGQSGVQPGGVRQQWGTAVSCRLARESVAFWREAERRLESTVALGFRRCGYLFLAHSDAAVERLQANVEVQHAAGVPSRLVGRDEAAVLVPGLQVHGVTGGSWCSDDGYFDRPQAVIEAFARGLDVRIAEASELRRDGELWEVRSQVGSFRAPAVVLAAGVASAELLAPLGVGLPIVPETRHLFLGAPVSERLLEPLVISAERGFAAKQLGDGRVLVADLTATGDPAESASRWRARVREVIGELLPALEYVDLSIVVSGDYDVTPDRQPILGHIPGAVGLLIAAGFSGHGFMIAPAVARILAEALEGSHDEVLDVLDPRRFAEGRLVPEPQVV
jgi:sarcosine oxidase, subunit beta